MTFLSQTHRRPVLQSGQAQYQSQTGRGVKVEKEPRILHLPRKKEKVERRPTP